MVIAGFVVSVSEMVRQLKNCGVDYLPKALSAVGTLNLF